MNRNLDDSIKDLYPATPFAFSQSVRRALETLPERKPRRFLPTAAAVAATVPVLIALGVFFSFMPKPVPDVIATPGVTPSAGPTAANASAPLPTLTQRKLDGLPQAADGWQIVAFNDNANWYYNPKTGEVARIEIQAKITTTTSADLKGVVSVGASVYGDAVSGTLQGAVVYGPTTAYALAFSSGQSIDSYSFVASSDGRWLAFTVHGSSGDDIWIVTANGKSLSVLDNVQWVDSNTSQSYSLDLSGATMVPRCGYNRADDDQLQMNDTQAAYQNTIEITILKSGRLLGCRVWLDDLTNYPNLQMNNRRGQLTDYGTRLTGDESLVTGNTVEQSDLVFSTSLTPEGNGYYLVGGDHIGDRIRLDSDRCSFLRILKSMYGKQIEAALVIYKEDASRTLWEIDCSTGKATRIAEGCVAAGWLTQGQYWFATQANATTAELKSIPANENLTIAMSCYSSGIMNELTIRVNITNWTGHDVVIDRSSFRDLVLKKDGKTIWSAQALSEDTRINYITIVDLNAKSSAGAQLPLTLKPGLRLDLEFDEGNFTGNGTYTIDCAINNQEVSESTKYPQFDLPDFISISGAIQLDRRLALTFRNDSFQSFRISYRNSRQYSSFLLPLKMSYKLLSGDKVVKTGAVTFPKDQGIVAAGGSLMLLETLDDPQFKDVPAGTYRLVGSMLEDAYQADTPPELAGFIPIDLEITIPGK